MRSAPLILIVFTLFTPMVLSQISTSFGNDPSFCCNPQPSARVVPVPQNVTDLVSESPSYGQVTSPTVYSNSQDSMCSTYFKIDDNTYIKFNGFGFSDGSYIIQKLILSPLTEYTGVNRIQGLVQDSGSSTLVTNQVYLGSACPGLKVYYTYYLAGRCDILNNATQVPGDYINAVFSTRDISEYCKGQVAALANTKQLKGSQLVGMPNRLNRRCVTQFNGVKCINADRVLPQDSVAVPDVPNYSQSCS